MGEKTGEKTPAKLRIRSHVPVAGVFLPQNWAKRLLGQKTRGKPLVNGLPQWSIEVSLASQITDVTFNNDNVANHI